MVNSLLKPCTILLIDDFHWNKDSPERWYVTTKLPYWRNWKALGSRLFKYTSFFSHWATNLALTNLQKKCDLRTLLNGFQVPWSSFFFNILHFKRSGYSAFRRSSRPFRKVMSFIPGSYLQHISFNMTEFGETPYHPLVIIRLVLQYVLLIS